MSVTPDVRPLTVPAEGPQGGPAAGPDAPWERVCHVDDLFPERGAAALLGTDGDPARRTQVALFRLTDGRVLAVQQQDPFSGANVLSRGIVGTRGGVPTVASPVYKQVFSLLTGECLETAGYSPKPGLDADLRAFPVEVRDGVVHVAVA